MPDAPPESALCARSFHRAHPARSARRFRVAAARSALSALCIAALALPAAAQTFRSDAGRPDPRLAPYGLEAYRAVQEVCLPQTLGSPEAVRDVRLEPRPPQWVQDGARDLTGGVRTFASRPSSEGRIWIASLPAGRLCRVIAIDGPPRGRMFISADAAFRDNGWRLRRRVRDSVGYTERIYEHLRPGRTPDAVLNLREFVYGGGPTRRLRLLLTVQGYS